MNFPSDRRAWQQLPPERRRRWTRLGALAAGVQLGLLIAAQVDLSRRTDAQVRGRKLWWRLGTLVNFVGPLAYFLFGRVPRGA